VQIVEHALSEASQVPALQIGGIIQPWLLIIHYTASPSAAGPISWFQSPASKVSAHLVVDLDGSITQMVPFNRRAAHAGASRWGGQEGCNGFSIGIELVNPGPLRRRSDGTFADQSSRKWAGGVVEARHKHGNVASDHWAEFPEAQLGAARLACEAIVRAYGIREIVGHDDVAPTRKVDPGPAFPMHSFQNICAPRDDDGGDAYVAISELNVRSGPGVEHPKVEGGPLVTGQRVYVVAVQGSWWHVHALGSALEGWVSSRYLRNV
jgi:N-acetylmuramoyl-L-alanine amidase